MSNTLIGTTNLLATATLKSGTGGGAPALDETSPYTTAKTQTSDRYSIWTTSSAPTSPVNVDFDLGSNRTVTAAACLGFRGSATPSATALKVYSAPSASGYVPASWTQQADINISALTDTRDFGEVFASVSHRYWRFEFTAVATFSVGRLWLGNPTDLGLIHTPGGVDSPFQNRLETPQPNGSIILNTLGDPGRDVSLPFANQTSALRDTLQALSTQTGSILYVDADERFFECLVRGGKVPASRTWNSIYDMQLELVRMP